MMTHLAIRNPVADWHADELTRKVFKSITPHWRSLLPEIEVVISSVPFNQVPELQKYCLEQESRGINQDYWRSAVRVICPHQDEMKAVVWVYYPKDTNLEEMSYEFQKSVYEMIAKLIWTRSTELRRMASAKAGLNSLASHMIFRDSFSRYFLNPEWLKTRRETAWEFISHIDSELQK